MTITISKPLLFALIALIAAVGIMAGFYLSNRANEAQAQTACVVNDALLRRLYNAIFHRSIDTAGARFHAGKDIETVLSDLENADEHALYTGLFRAVKALEERKRETGEISQADLERFRNIIDSALAHIAAWADTLPEQTRDRAVVGPDQARSAIEAARLRMNATARDRAETGLIRALERIGPPSTIDLPAE